jgi:Amt family ammonium transporter
VSFGAQLIGTLLGVAWALVAGFAVYGAIKAFMGLRLTPEEEHEGADLAIHKIGSTPEREATW